MWMVVGSQALAVMDNEAQWILMDFVERYYLEAMDKDVMFALAFESAAMRIMGLD